jgi:hypothetical protein
MRVSARFLVFRIITMVMALLGIVWTMQYLSAGKLGNDPNSLVGILLGNPSVATSEEGISARVLIEPKPIQAPSRPSQKSDH